MLLLQLLQLRLILGTLLARRDLRLPYRRRPWSFAGAYDGFRRARCGGVGVEDALRGERFEARGEDAALAVALRIIDAAVEDACDGGGVGEGEVDL